MSLNGYNRRSAPRGGFRPQSHHDERLHEISHADQNMNENLSERFGRGTAIRDSHTSRAVAAKPPVTLNLSIREYAKIARQPTDPSHWTGFPECPSPDEIFDKGRKNHGETIEINPNTVVGPYLSKKEYLESHYRLLREDAVTPLRDAVSEIQVYPHLMEKESDNSAYIYEKVFITGLTFANAGIAARVTFSLRRSGKRVNWEQSKRLLAGQMLALTPAKDMFASICRVAIVAARPLAGLEKNPPEIDIFFGAAEDFEIDPQQEWIMVESRNGFFEGSRHTLRELQMLSRENFPLSQHIVDIERIIDPPDYLEKQPLKNLLSLFPTASDDTVRNTNIIENWPSEPCNLDASQVDALKRILTKRVAVVQGPPGTGKTHISVTALRLLLENSDAQDPPIIISAHTNHALDSLLSSVAKFDPGFVRLGGWTKDTEVIKPRTLFEIKEAVKLGNPAEGLRKPALAKLKELAKKMTMLLSPLTQETELLNSKPFKDYNVISYNQHDSLVKGAKEWIRAGTEDEPLGDIAMWLGDDRVDAKYRTLPEDLGIDFEEADLEYERLKEIEAESKVMDDGDRESLWGQRLIFCEPFTGRQGPGVTEETVRFEMKKRDMWKIPSEHRGPVYRHMQQSLKTAITKKFRELARQYAGASQDAKIGMWESDYNYLKEAKIIGMTTTGLSKYRGLVQSLNPKIVLVEEAAETLEGFVSVACFKSLEHLILVGDHLQLRGHTNDPDLACEPYYLGVSMFERLVRNKIEYSQLKRQRRMIPEIRRTLKPIYEDLEDHASVLDRLPIPGMGGVNSYFFTHQWQETTDIQMSKINQEEADMVVEFFGYLVLNGISPAEITVLTFYNGQRKLVLRKLREKDHQLQSVKVVNVDGYQGEENEVVLLSLVRSNPDGNIGFLNVENRVCVALSRARRGFYLFGNAEILCKSSMLWWDVVQAMAKHPCRVGFHLPLTCKKHNERTFTKRPKDFDKLNGGCFRPCQEELPCGHPCLLVCHPFPHEETKCKYRCNRQLPCGHHCTKLCSLPCKSDCACESSQPPSSPQLEGQIADEGQTHHKDPLSTEPYRIFAAGGHVEHDKNLGELGGREAARKELDKENYQNLFGDQQAKTSTSTLIRKMPNGKNIWKEIYGSSTSKGANPRKREESSLLDGVEDRE